MWFAPSLSDPLSYGIAFSGVIFLVPSTEVSVKIAMIDVYRTHRGPAGLPG